MTGRPITNYNSLSLLPLLSAMAAGSAPNTSRTQMPSFADRCEHEDENAVQRAVLVAAQVSAPDVCPTYILSRVAMPYVRFPAAVSCRSSEACNQRSCHWRCASFVVMLPMTELSWPLFS